MSRSGVSAPHCLFPLSCRLRPPPHTHTPTRAEYHCYCSDITCTYPIGATFSHRQRLVYEGVLDSQRAVIAKMRPGVNCELRWMAGLGMAHY